MEICRSENYRSGAKNLDRPRPPRCSSLQKSCRHFKLRLGTNVQSWEPPWLRCTGESLLEQDNKCEISNKLMETDFLITSCGKDGSEVVRKTGVVMIVKDSARRAYFLKVTFFLGERLSAIIFLVHLFSWLLAKCNFQIFCRSIKETPQTSW